MKKNVKIKSPTLKNIDLIQKCQKFLIFDSKTSS
jgi:hypothetical protein